MSFSGLDDQIKKIGAGFLWCLNISLYLIKKFSYLSRIRRRKSKTKKYGVISTPANDLEMAPLDDPDDDDEDMTVFEVNGVPK